MTTFELRELVRNLSIDWSGHGGPRIPQGKELGRLISALTDVVESAYTTRLVLCERYEFPKLRAALERLEDLKL